MAAAQDERCARARRPSARLRFLTVDCSTFNYLAMHAPRGVVEIGSSQVLSLDEYGHKEVSNAWVLLQAEEA